MQRGQVVVVDLDDLLDELELILGQGATLHPVDDLDEGIEMAAVVGADAVVVNDCDGSVDPLDVVAKCAIEDGVRVRAFIFWDSTNPRRSRYVEIEPATNEYRVRDVDHSTLPIALGRILEEDEEDELGGGGADLSEIGFNDQVRFEGDDYLVQTETHQGQSVVVRTAVFKGGRRLNVREHPADPSLGYRGVEELAARVHKESIEDLESL